MIKNNNKIVAIVMLLLGIATLFFGYGCDTGEPKEPAGSYGTTPAKKEDIAESKKTLTPDAMELMPAKQILIMRLTKLNRQKNHNVLAYRIRGLVSSGNGEFVYLVGEENQSLRALNVEKNTWDNALDWTKIKSAGNHASPPVNLSRHKVGAFAPLPNGIAFTVSDNKGLVLLRGMGEANTSHYAQNTGNFALGAYVPFYVQDANKNEFLYLFATKRVPTGGAILFKPLVRPGQDDKVGTWDNSTSIDGRPIDTYFRARAQDQHKNLLLSDSTNKGIQRINAADVGVSKKTLAKSGRAIIDTKNFRLKGDVKNKHINTMAFVDNKLLVVGLKSTNQYNGGVAVADMTAATPVWKTFGAGMGISVDYISEERGIMRDRTKIAAVITTNKGFLFLGNDGNMIELVPGKGYLVDSQFVGDNRAEKDNYAKAASGFLGDRFTGGTGIYKGAAESKKGLWYLGIGGRTADENGLFILDITIDNIQSRPAPDTATEALP